MARFIEIEAKSILTKHKFRDDWFWDRYAINPYRGCQFACNYCDAITEKYLVHKDYKDFSRIIYVKKKAPELLEKEVKKVKPDVVAMSGVTDPYQLAEKKYELTSKSANPYSAWAYHKASQNIEKLNEGVKEIYKRGELIKIQGVGKSIFKIIEDYLTNGSSERLDKEMNAW